MSEDIVELDCIKCQVLFNLLRDGCDIKDVTVLQKLESIWIKIFRRVKERSWELADRTGMLNFFESTLTLSFLKEHPDNVSFAIKLVAGICMREENFQKFMDDNRFAEFHQIIPKLKDNLVLLWAGVDVVKSLMRHDTGLRYIVEHQLWNEILLPGLRSRSTLTTAANDVMTEYIRVIYERPEFEDVRKVINMDREDIFEGKKDIEEILLMLKLYERIYFRDLGNISYVSPKNMYSGAINIPPKLHDITFDLDLLTSLDDKRFNKIVPSVTNVVILRILNDCSVRSIAFKIPKPDLKGEGVEQQFIDVFEKEILSLYEVLIMKKVYKIYPRLFIMLSKYWYELRSDFKLNNGISLHNVYSIPLFNLHIQLTANDCLIDEKYAENEKRSLGDFLSVDNTNHFNRIMNEIKNNPHDAIDLINCNLDSNDQLMFPNEEGISFIPADGRMAFFESYSALLNSVSGKIMTGKISRLSKKILEVMHYSISNYYILKGNSGLTIKCIKQMCDMTKKVNNTNLDKNSSLKVIKSCIEHGFKDCNEMECNTVLQYLSEVLFKYINDVAWDVRDSVLEVILALMEIRCESVSKWAIENNLIDSISIVMEDAEDFVRITAYSVLTAMVKFDKIQEILDERNFTSNMCTTVLKEGESNVRKMAAKYLFVYVFYVKKLKDEDKSTILEIMQHLTQDSETDVRVIAIEYFQQILDSDLKHLGVELTSSYPVNSSNPIITCNNPNIEDELYKLLTMYCSNGTISAISNLCDDCDIVICYYFNFMRLCWNLIDTFNLKEKFKNSMKESNQSNEIPSSNLQQTTDQDDVKSNQQNSESVLEEIVNANDISHIERIENKIKNGRPCEVPHLSISKFPSVSLYEFFKLMVSAEKRSYWYTVSAEYEFLVLHSLLDDIIAGQNSTANYDDQRELDCY